MAEETAVAKNGKQYKSEREAAVGAKLDKKGAAAVKAKSPLGLRQQILTSGTIAQIISALVM